MRPITCAREPVVVAGAMRRQAGDRGLHDRSKEHFRKDTAMSTREMATSLMSTDSDTIAKLLRQYGCGPIQFAGTDNAFYERHLAFDHVVDPMAPDARERFEAVARSVRDVLAQRWLRTEQTYERDNPKRV